MVFCFLVRRADLGADLNQMLRSFCLGGYMKLLSARDILELKPDPMLEANYRHAYWDSEQTIVKMLRSF